MSESSKIDLEIKYGPINLSSGILSEESFLFNSLLNKSQFTNSTLFILNLYLSKSDLFKSAISLIPIYLNSHLLLKAVSIGITP